MMIAIFRRHHAGNTLVELIIFIAILSLVMGTALPILFSATENRLLQQTISHVEQNGTQVLQHMTQRIREAERIVSPLPGQSASVLVLQTGSGTRNPTVIGVSTGTIVIIERSKKSTVSSQQVAIQDFVVRNTSTSASRQSVEISFRVSRTIRLQLPHSYAQYFRTAVRLHPSDAPVGACGCGSPTCANNRYTWHFCSQELGCLSATTELACP